MAFANSGGTEHKDVPLPGDDSYIGSYVPDGDASGGDVHVDSGFDGNVFGGYSDSGNVSGNKVDFSGGHVKDGVYGGHSHSGSASGNRVDMSGGSTGDSVYGGAVDEKGDANNNTVNVSGGTVGRDVYGGWSGQGNANGNNVTISGDGRVKGDAYGGYAGGKGDASGNNLTMNGGEVDGGVFGGYSRGGNATGNHVYLKNGLVRDGDAAGGVSVNGDASGNSLNSDDSIFNKNIYGGKSTYGNADGNHVRVNHGLVGGGVSGGSTDSGNANDNGVEVGGDSVIDGNIYGGYSNKGNARNNHVLVKDEGTQVEGDVFGGHSGGGDATGNSVEIEGSQIGGSVSGGYSAHGSANGNYVHVKGGTVGKDVSGGETANGDADGNGVSLDGGEVGGDIYGGNSHKGGSANNNGVNISKGKVKGSVYGGAAQDGSANGNTVTVSGGEVDGGIRGGSSSHGNANNNTVTVSGGSVDGDIYGGWAGDGGNATGNTINMTGGQTTWDLIGGYADGHGSANGNKVSLSGKGKVSGRIYGGYANGDGDANNNSVSVSGGEVGGDISGGYSAGGNATGNTVDISGGHIGGDVYGGYVKGGQGNATGNRVRVSGTPNFDPNTTLYGGWSGGRGDARTDNTLEINASGIHVKNAVNFQHYLFGISKSSVGKLMLNTDDFVVMTPRGGPDADLGLQFHDRDRMDVGDKVGLMNRGEGPFDINGKRFETGKNDHMNVHQDAGLRSRDYDFHVKLTEDGSAVRHYKVDVQVDHVTDDYLNPKAGNVMIPRTVALAVLNKGGDFIANEGINAARIAGGFSRDLNAGGIDDVQSGAFGAVTGGHLNYRLDGHTAVNGLSLLGGYGVGIPLSQGQALVGAFVEGGWSSYNGRSNQGVNSDGTSRYFGGGVLTRYELSGFYVEGSGRAGRSENHYDSDFSDSTGESARYKTDTTYYGLHAGVGYVMSLGGGVSLDPSTKYFWTHQTGSNVSILGDPIRFRATNSQRWRTGARINVAVAPGVVPYIGGYYEHEFDSKAKATDYGFNITAPSIRGDTGIAEVGVTFGAPADVFKVDLGVQGYAGKRSGVIGSLKGKWKF